MRVAIAVDTGSSAILLGMAVGFRTAIPGTPYRSNATPPSDPRVLRRKRKLRLAVPPLVAAALVGIPALVLGLENGVATEHCAFVVGSLARIEDAAVWMFVGTVPLLAFALVVMCRTFAAPRRTKWRYVTRRLLVQAALVFVAVWIARGESPRPTLPLLATTTRADGRRAFVYRFSWGCSYELRAGDGPGRAKLVTIVGPFSCDGPSPRVVWEGNDLTIVAADGEIIGTWPADR